MDLREDSLNVAGSAIQGMDSRHVLILGELPEAIVLLFGVQHRQVSLSVSERNHIYARHTELRGEERYIVNTIRNPEEIHRDLTHERTVNLFAPMGISHDMMISVEISDEDGFARIKSARKHRAKRTDTLRRKVRETFGDKGVLWERKRE